MALVDQLNDLIFNASDTKFWIELLLIFRFSNIAPKKIKWRNLQVANPSRVKYVGLSRYVVVVFCRIIRLQCFCMRKHHVAKSCWASYVGPVNVAPFVFSHGPALLGASDYLMGKSVPGLFHWRSLDAMGHCLPIRDFGLHCI